VSTKIPLYLHCWVGYSTHNDESDVILAKAGIQAILNSFRLKFSFWMPHIKTI